MAMSSEPKASRAESELLAAVRQAARQEQFLEVVSAEEARKRFNGHLDLTPLPGERVMLAAALGRVLAGDLAAPIDVPPFDRANVDGFALRAADSAGAAAVVMIEHTELVESIPAIELRRGVAAGQFISYAGSDIARGETLMRKGQLIGSR